MVFEIGAIQFFKKLDIGTFDLGDFLGNALTSFPFIPIAILYRFFCYRRLDLFCVYLSAIGAIFAATDSVCTLQVMCDSPTSRSIYEF